VSGRSVMIAAILFAVSAVALAHFALYYWRAMIGGIAQQPVSERVRTAARISSPAIRARDFRTLLSLHDLSPDLRGPGGGFHAVRAYYWAVEKIGSLIPPMTLWADAEMTTCARYVAVLVDRHLERNIACAAQMRGM
jgi:hypothetical protein